MLDGRGDLPYDVKEEDNAFEGGQAFGGQGIESHGHEADGHCHEGVLAVKTRQLHS